MKIKKKDLIDTYAQSVGIEKANEIVDEKIRAIALEDKTEYNEEEIFRIYTELVKEGGIISIVGQTFLLQLEHKKLEEQRLLLDNIETQIWYLTDMKTYGSVNKAHAKFLGKIKENLEDKNINSIFSKTEAEILIARNRKVFEKKKQTHSEEYVKNSRGNVCLMSITRTPKLDDNGNVAYVICAAEDITERRRAEEKIKMLAQAVDTTSDAIVISDMDGKIEYANRALLQNAGVKTEKELKGHNLLEFLPPESQKRIKEEIIPSIIKKGVWNGELEVLRRNKSHYTAILSSSTIRDKNGKLWKKVGIFKDISDRKKAEKRTKKSLAEKNVLLKEIHHRVKNNLQIISSMLNMQAKIVKDKKMIDILSESRNRINTMALIHAQLYENENLSEINMKKFTERLLMQLLQIYPTTNIKITQNIRMTACLAPIVIAIPIGLIINELLTNILKYAFAGRKEGRIDISLTVSGKGKIILTVSDDGIGLPTGFDIDKSKTLGLHLIKILVENQLQGTMKITCKKGKGTAFKIKFKTGTD